jgi:hypothetical protein
VESSLELIRYLDDPQHDLVRVAVFVQQAELDHRVVAANVAFNVNHLVVLQVFFQFLLEYVERVGEIDFKGTGIVGGGLHAGGLEGYHRIRAEAHVKPLPNAAKQIKSFSLILPSAQASLNAIGMDAAVVLP